MARILKWIRQNKGLTIFFGIIGIASLVLAIFFKIEGILGLVFTILGLFLTLYIQKKQEQKEEKKEQREEERHKEVLEEIQKVQPKDAKPELKDEIASINDRITTPKTADDWFIKAYAAQIDGNFETAIRHYEKVINEKPDAVSAYVNMGVAYVGLDGQYEKAIKCFEKAIELKPDYAEAYYNMGLAYGQKSNGKEGIEFIKKAARLGYEPAQILLQKNGESW
ncbi:MAG: tetratricopeptide repeat protein [Bacteroidales bacterium]|jgi:tetratricopeptide (TPR) repeat protein|nr:tetratricopeptide repeat protein [Bacteroidales bacterium]